METPSRGDDQAAQLRILVLSALSIAQCLAHLANDFLDPAVKQRVAVGIRLLAHAKRHCAEYHEPRNLDRKRDQDCKQLCAHKHIFILRMR